MKLLKQILNPRISPYVFSLALLLITNNKAYIVIFAIYGLILFTVNKFSLMESLFATLLLSLPFERGLRAWFIRVVSPGPHPWIPGYDFYFGIAPKMIIFVVLFFMLVLIKKGDGQKLKPIDFILLIFLLLSVIGTFVSENSNLASLGLVRLFTSIGLFFVGSRLFIGERMRELFRNTLIAILLLLGIVGSLQLINRQPLGLFLEDSGATRPLGYLTTDGEPFYRVSGLMGHPTFFGSFLTLLIPVSFGFLLSKKSKRWSSSKYVAVLALTLGLISLFATFSRSGWMAIVLSGMIFIWLGTKKNVRALKFWLLAAMIMIIVVALSIFVPAFFSRLQSFNDIWTIGNGRGRINLVLQAWEMIKQAPVWGVGLNRFTQVMSTNDLSLEARGFLFPVHNTFLLFFSELGVPAGLLFLVFVVYIFWQSWKKIKNNWISTGIWVGAFTFLINAQFHTLFSQDPSLEVFILMLGYLSTL